MNYYNTCHETGVILVRIVPILMGITNAPHVELITRKISALSQNYAYIH